MPVSVRSIRSGGVRAALALSVAALLWAAPAAAHADAPAESPAQAIATALAESPVYVDPSYDSAFPEEARTAAVAAIEGSGLPVRVVLAPLVDGDTWDGDAQRLAAAVHDRAGGGDAHYLLLEDGRLVGTDMPASTTEPSDQRAHYAALAASYATDFDAPVAEQVELAVEYAVSDDPAAAYEEQMRAYEESQELGSATPETGSEPGTDARADTGSGAEGSGGPGGVWPWIGGGAVAVLLLVGGYLWWTRRRPMPTLPQHAAFANADQARREALERQVDREITEVGERLGALRPAPGTAASRALGEALDAHDAARRVAETMREGSLADVVGALVLLDLAEDGLAAASSGRGSPARRRHCYANPLHGTDTTETDWRRLGATQTVRVPLCGACAKAVRTRTRLNVLHVAHEGRSVPYHEVPVEESVWAATGFGALADDLVQRIQRGAHRSGR
ncbi:hypothetical protein DFP74_3578 [Nocardiopsis sp. Huas11]|uniref:hypothetical protein n=1 Tax=Nocardiopsis sp. Huas11 TaxID=2183912 RepID=UPI000F2472F4|nr:hypothetical protein [Nocardiopsis sp. Huas11]RKS07892.1 hypothetical protein DFP74_3578 [Nocardiopsis sp. Huas11]